MKHWIAVVGGSVLILTSAACSSSSNSGSSYKPQTRNIEMVTIQELIGEFANIPDLKDEIDAALAPNGPLGGHEVYGWYPSAITVYQGDTVVLDIHNAQGDEHMFSLPDFGITGTHIPPDSAVKVTFKASKLGTFQYFCSVPEHTPWMQGFLTVLPDSDAG